MATNQVPDGTRLRVAAVQINSTCSTQENLASIERATVRASRVHADAVLFPECATTSYACDFRSLDRRTIHGCLESLSSIAAKTGVNLLVGTPFFYGKQLLNALVMFDRSGRLAHVYAKCQLTPADRQWFTPGDNLSLFSIDGVQATSIICHERRYPELVRFPVMAGARIVFHPNAGMDALEVSRTKRGGKDGIAARAFENAVYYVFANTVGPQGNAKWSAGDSKIVGADGRILRLAGNSREQIIHADLDIEKASRKYAVDALEHPKILARAWPGLLKRIRKGAETSNRRLLAAFANEGG